MPRDSYVSTPNVRGSRPAEYCVTRSKCNSSSPLLKNGKAAAKTKTRRAAVKHNSKISNRWLRNIASMFAILFIKVERRDDLNVTPSGDADFHDCVRSGVFCCEWLQTSSLT